ncbi:STY0301 family protein [Acidovorax sp. Leaf78]|uniref:STY0301 family protein n=1 Tax=unclassified Acidovorax TaxID=2684926 RepID=UPI0006FA0FB8|nr:STY0301 family protein [Acidovorax sp. Leaf78]KQO16813.1 hypothetical protein ASF16_12990 [Acidovorax sp. Leaf78]
MAIRWHSVFFLTVFSATGCAIAQTGHTLSGIAHEGTCPASIQVQQTLTAEPPAGWQAVGSSRNHYLNNVSLYSGPPEERAHLMPSSERRKGKTWVVTWLLYPQDLPYWVACEYAQTAAVITKPLEKSITSCTVEYDRNISPVIFKRWSCRSGDLQ